MSAHPGLKRSVRLRYISLRFTHAASFSKGLVLTTFEFLPPISFSTLGLCIAAVAAVYFIGRLLFGSAETIARRRLLIGLRCAVLMVLAMLFLNPVKTTEIPGDIDRPELFYKSSPHRVAGSNIRLL